MNADGADGADGAEDDSASGGSRGSKMINQTVRGLRMFLAKAKQNQDIAGLGVRFAVVLMVLSLLGWLGLACTAPFTLYLYRLGGRDTNSTHVPTDEFKEASPVPSAVESPVESDREHSSEDDVVRPLLDRLLTDPQFKSESILSVVAYNYKGESMLLGRKKGGHQVLACNESDSDILRQLHLAKVQIIDESASAKPCLDCDQVVNLVGEIKTARAVMFGRARDKWVKWSVSKKGSSASFVVSKSNNSETESQNKPPGQLFRLVSKRWGTELCLSMRQLWSNDPPIYRLQLASSEKVKEEERLLFTYQWKTGS